MRKSIRYLIAGVWLIGFDTAAAANPIVYPSQGQSFQQQSADEAACQQWAQQQTAYTPSQVPPAYQGSRESLIGGGARGAAVGAVGGAILGDAGQGAKAGAAMGATATVFRNSRQRRQNAQNNAQAQAQYDQSAAQYNSAFAACMTGRGYAVK